jgi:predicted metal-dependent phosphoesterase TrpH
MMEYPSLKADLHVHSYHSGYATHLPFFKSRDSYSTPEEIYRQAKTRGMDLVTITDHNSIDGCLEFLDRHSDVPDFFMGEEIECAVPDSPIKLHLGALGINERIHREIQPLRDNVFDVTGYLKREEVAFTLNHMFHFFRGQITVRSYLEKLLHLFPAVEVRNGMMLRCQNELISQILDTFESRGLRFGRVSGSDAHVLGRVGKTYTEVPGRNREEFLANIRSARPCGKHGSAVSLVIEIYGVIFNYWGSLLGFRRDELSNLERIMGIGFSLMSLPFQVAPLAVALSHAAGESIRVDKWRREWIPGPVPSRSASIQL